MEARHFHLERNMFVVAYNNIIYVWNYFHIRVIN